MSDTKTTEPDRPRQREIALARRDDEGGAGPQGPQDTASAIVPMTNAEVLHLRVRVIALENLVITLLVEASDRQLQLVREMAAYISPRPDHTRHPLTIHAAAQMVDLVVRASHFRAVPPV